ncbi:MAG TPA: hypothetical protein VKV02_02455, partial [Acidobacteriaceae bacterium]|nr:hypothetical protein [Acidobacteriaceae bacterium]
MSERITLTVVSLAAMFLLINAAFHSSGQDRHGPSDPISNRQLAWVLGPFCLAYFTLLLPRALFVPIFDRYLLLPLPLLILLLLRWFGSGRQAQIPGYSFAVLAFVAFYSIATTHDYFATHRASLAAADELRRAGVPRSAIDNGWEYNRYTQLLTDGYVRVEGVRMPDGTSLPYPQPIPVGPCYPESIEQIPALHPQYAIAYPSSACARVPEFQPVGYRTYLPPFHRTLYIVRTAKPPADAAPAAADE